MAPQARRNASATLIASGRKAPMHAATSTSVGQCTPSTSRDMATRPIHRIATGSARLRADGQIRVRPMTAAVAKAATASVCPLGKLEPH